MNLRSCRRRVALMTALLVFAIGAALVGRRLNADAPVATNSSTPIVFLPFVALPLVHALLSP